MTAHSVPVATHIACLGLKKLSTESPLHRFRYTGGIGKTREPGEVYVTSNDILGYATSMFMNVRFRFQSVFVSGKQINK